MSYVHIYCHELYYLDVTNSYDIYTYVLCTHIHIPQMKHTNLILALDCDFSPNWQRKLVFCGLGGGGGGGGPKGGFGGRERDAGYDVRS